MALATSAFALTSCDYSEDALEPSGIASAYTLPQGDHAYDQKIVEIQKKYGTSLLYKFNDKDAYWSPTSWSCYEYNEETPNYSKAGLTCTPANEAYVGQLVDMLEEVWFSRFNDKFLKEYLPQTILLCDQHDSCWVKTNSTFDWSTSPVTITYTYEEMKQEVPAWYIFNHISVAYGNSSVTTLSEAKKTTMLKYILHLWGEYIKTNFVKPTEEFTKAVAYGAFSPSNNYGKVCCGDYGILSQTYAATPENDWIQFMYMMMIYPETWLNDETAPEWGNYDGFGYSNEAKLFRGILTSKKDTKGLLKKRYDMVRQYYIDNYDFDLQSVGNTF